MTAMTADKHTNGTKEQRTRDAILFLALKEAGADQFLINVIACHHKNAMRKLRGLLRFAEQGRDVRTSQFNLDVLLIDGEYAAWESLELAA
jgi:hypothetical protein